MKKIRLYDIAHSRTGDKGDHNTLSLIPYNEKDYPILKEFVTAEAVKEHMKDIVKGKVTRYELDNIQALSFFLEHSLKGGVTTSLAVDIHGKSFSSALLSMEIEVPEITKKEVYLPMHDGCKLRTFIYYPETQEASVPCIVMRTPYGGADSLDARASHYCYKGYGVVFQMCRGTGGSEGEWVPYIHEKEDGQDLLQYLENESWCKSIGLVGNSYLSFVWWLLGDCLTPKVRTAFLGNFGLDRHHSAYSDGLFRHDILTGWSMHNAGFKPKGTYAESCRHWPMITTDTEVWGKQVDWYRDYISHPCSADDYWDKGIWGEVRRLGKNVKFPSLCMLEGWFDHHLGSALHSYEWLTDEMRAHTQLLVGPWNHSCDIEAGYKGIENIDELKYDYLIEQWLDKVLMRGEKPETGIRFYEIGAKRWISPSSYPIAVDKKTLYFSLSKDGKKELVSSPSKGSVFYKYDPTNPVLTCGGETLLYSQNLLGCKKQPRRDYREDVLSFVSEPLDEKLSIVGPITVNLRVASMAKDTAFCVKICEELENGTAYNLRTIIKSLKYRNGSKHCEEYTPGEFVDIGLKAADIAWCMNKGSRIRIDVSSSDFPQYAAHPNSDELWCMVAEPIIATQTVDCSGCLVELPVS